MDTKLIDNWNRQQNFYLDFAGKNDITDLRLKSLISLNDRKFLFSSLTSFDFCNHASKHTFEGKLLNERRIIDFQINSLGEFDSDAEVLVAKKGDFKLYSYFKGDLKQGPHSRIFNTNLRLSFQHKQLISVIFGLNDWDPIAHSPKTAELGASFSINNEAKTQKYVLNTIFSFSTKNSNLLGFKSLIKSERPNYEGLYLISNSLDKDDKKEVYINYSFVKKVNEKIKIGGSVTHSLSTCDTTYDFIAKYSGKELALDALISSNQEIKLTVSSVISESTKVALVSSHKPSGNHIGLSLEYSRI